MNERSNPTDAGLPVSAVTYARVSTDDQGKHGTSIGTQQERTREFVDQCGWVLADEFVDDGVSGALEARPGLDALKAQCLQGDIQVMVVTDVDRFSRDLRLQLNLHYELETVYGLRVVFLQDPEMSVEMRQINGVFSELERRKIRERTMRGVDAVVSKGYWAGGPPPYGFRVEPVEGTKHKRLAIDVDEASTLRTAVDALVDEGVTTGEVADRLNALGGRSRTGRRWTHRTVRRTLLDANLSGTWTFARQRGQAQTTARRAPVVVAIPEILSLDRHEQLRAALRTTATKRSVNRFYLLSRDGMLTMPCGGRAFGTHRDDRGYQQYICENRRTNAPVRCECRRMNCADLDTVVWDAVVSLLSEPDRLVAMAHDYLGTSADRERVDRTQIQDVDREIVALRRTLDDTVADYLKAGVDGRSVKAATANLEADLRGLESHRATLQVWEDQAVDESNRMQRLWELADAAHTRLHDMTPQEQRRVLELLAVQVRATGFATCERCDGSGRIPGGRGKLGGHTCPPCAGTRVVPSVEIEGRVRDALLAEGTRAGVGILAATEARGLAPRPEGDIHDPLG